MALRDSVRSKSVEDTQQTFLALTRLNKQLKGTQHFVLLQTEEELRNLQPISVAELQKYFPKLNKEHKNAPCGCQWRSTEIELTDGLGWEDPLYTLGLNNPTEVTANGRTWTPNFIKQYFHVPVVKATSLSDNKIWSEGEEVMMLEMTSYQFRLLLDSIAKYKQNSWPNPPKVYKVFNQDLNEAFDETSVVGKIFSYQYVEGGGFDAHNINFLPAAANLSKLEEVMGSKTSADVYQQYNDTFVNRYSPQTPKLVTEANKLVESFDKETSKQFYEILDGDGLNLENEKVLPSFYQRWPLLAFLAAEKLDEFVQITREELENMILSRVTFGENRYNQAGGNLRVTTGLDTRFFDTYRVDGKVTASFSEKDEADGEDELAPF